MRCKDCGVPIGPNDIRCHKCAQNKTKEGKGQLGRRDTLRAENSMDDSWVGISTASDPLAKQTMPSMNTSIVLDNKYRLINEIGRGAMGTVFLAEDTSLKRMVAVKFLLPELACSADSARRFELEAVGMAAVRDNNVAQIYSFGEHNGTPYFVMEYLDGQTLEDMIEAHNRRGFFIPLDNALDILVQTVSGLGAIHSAGVVHRDIKPANILISNATARAAIMDFGLVRNVRVEEETRALAGTPAYMAPELAEGNPGADRSPLTDIYSLGATAYEVLTGMLPFTGESWIEILRKHITEVPPFPSERRPGIPEELDDIVFRALAKDPKERYRNCDEILEDLIQVAQITEPKEPLRPSRAPNQPPRKRHTSKALMSKPPSTYRSAPSSHNRGRMVVADSDAEFRSFVHSIAKATVPGCRIHSATDGAMALDLIEQLRPDVLLLDLALPEVNGLEVVGTVRGDPQNDGMSIIVVATRGGKKEIDILNRMQIHRFLNKPIDLQTLADVLRPLLEHPLYRNIRSTPSLIPPK